MKINLLLVATSLIYFFSCNYSTETYKEGKLSYEFQCAPCHGINGEGLGTLYPKLVDTGFLKLNRANIPCWIHNGIGPESFNERPTRFSDQVMPSIENLSAIEMCNILNYLNARLWHSEEFTIQEITNSLSHCRHTKNDMKQPETVK